MRGVLVLAFRYLAFYRWRTAILVACVGLTLFLPVAAQMVLADFQRQLMSRAAATPLVLGARGSRFDLALHALYFDAQPPATITMAAADQVRESTLALPLPLLIRQRARGFPVVGTTLEYFDFRELRPAQGTSFVRLGDCVLGAVAARRLGLGPGDRLLTDPQNVFDIAGAYPLKMRVVGVLAESQSPDDQAIFVDLKTAWIIEGIGHGHQKLDTTTDEGVVLERKPGQVVAGAALPQYTEITDENIASFHFHGARSEFPLTAVIAVPRNQKAATLLMGRYLGPNATVQILEPLDVVDELLDLVFRIKRFFDLSAWLLALVTALFLGLVLILSRRLREREMRTLFKLGCSRFTIFWMQTAEVTLVLTMAAAAATAMAAITRAIAPELLRAWLLS
jgi:putative ABC transport system permease protein